MPAHPRRLLAIPDAIEQLDQDLLTRRDIERLFGVSKVRAAQLMTAFGAGRTGHLPTLPRAELLRHRERAAFRHEETRRERVVTEIRRARLTGIRVAVPVEALEARRAGLPDGVTVEPDRIEVRFGGAHKAVGRLFALAQALVSDYEQPGPRDEPVAGRTGSEARRHEGRDAGALPGRGPVAARGDRHGYAGGPARPGAPLGDALQLRAGERGRRDAAGGRLRQESRGWLRLHEKGGKWHDVPAHHQAAEVLDDYLEACELDEAKVPLFQ